MSDLENNLKNFEMGDLLFKEGDPGGSIYIIKAGTVEVYQERKSQRHVLCTIGPGEILGAMTALDASPRTATVRAITPVKALFIEADRVKTLLKTAPIWAISLIKDLVARLKQADDLYIKAIIAEDSLQNSLFHKALLVSQGVEPLRDLLQTGIDSGNVSITDILVKICEMLRIIDDDASLIISSFRKAGLLSPIDQGKSVAFNPFESLTYFGSYAQKYKKESQAVTDLLAVGERQMILKISGIFKANAKDYKRKISVAYKSIENLFLKEGEKFNHEALNRAAGMGLLEVDKASAEPLLRFVPYELEMGVRSQHAIVLLLKEANEKEKSHKTLAY